MGDVTRGMPCSPGQKETIPVSGNLPEDALMEYSPLKWAGTRTLPPKSDPISILLPP